MHKDSLAEKKLTVVITTFNRKEPLLEQLKSLENQGHYDEYCIVVSDNHSDYNVKEWIESSLSADFLKIITVYSRPYNVGGDMNITLSFQIPRTEWMWLLSDDDITEPNSIQTVLNDIESHEGDNVCWIKYSISGLFKPNDNIRLNSITSFFDYYSNNHTAGEMVFMCNNVYRLSDLREFIPDVTTYNDTCMSQVLLPLLSVKMNHKDIQMSPISLTNYVEGRISYNLVSAYTRFGNVLYAKPLNMTRSEISAFKHLEFFTPNGLNKTLASISDKSLRWELFKKIFISHYKLFSLRAIETILFYLVYHFKQDTE